MSCKYICPFCNADDSTTCAFDTGLHGHIKLKDKEEARRVGCRVMYYTDRFKETGSYDDYHKATMPSPGEHALAPVGGALYRHGARRGRWRVMTVGRKWITFRSAELFDAQGCLLTFREGREDWPNGWIRDA